MTTTTGTATRIGTMARYRSIPNPDPPAGTPWSCSTTRPATDAAIAVISATGRRQGRADRRVSAVVMRAGLAGGAGLRCCHTAMAGGPASAARMATPASGHPVAAPPPGTKAMARPAPISTPAPGPQDGQLALAARDEHPRREQDHRRADHDQADEQEQEHGFDRRLGAEEQRQVLQQRRGDGQRVRGG